MDCSRCRRQIEDGELEGCWYCEGPLCSDCWDRFGVCGCPGSDQAQADLLKATTYEERREIILLPGLIGRTTRN